MKLKEYEEKAKQLTKELKNTQTRIEAFNMLVNSGVELNKIEIIIMGCSSRWANSYMLVGNDSTIASSLMLYANRMQE